MSRGEHGNGLVNKIKQIHDTVNIMKEYRMFSEDNDCI